VINCLLEGRCFGRLRWGCRKRVKLEREEKRRRKERQKRRGRGLKITQSDGEEEAALCVYMVVLNDDRKNR